MRCLLLASIAAATAQATSDGGRRLGVARELKPHGGNKRKQERKGHTDANHASGGGANDASDPTNGLGGPTAQGGAAPTDVGRFQIEGKGHAKEFHQGPVFRPGRGPNEVVLADGMEAQRGRNKHKNKNNGKRRNKRPNKKKPQKKPGKPQPKPKPGNGRPNDKPGNGRPNKKPDGGKNHGGSKPGNGSPNKKPDKKPGEWRPPVGPWGVGAAKSGKAGGWGSGGWGGGAWPSDDDHKSDDDDNKKDDDWHGGWIGGGKSQKWGGGGKHDDDDDVDDNNPWEGSWGGGWGGGGGGWVGGGKSRKPGAGGGGGSWGGGNWGGGGGWPTMGPKHEPTSDPTLSPTLAPTLSPSLAPTFAPTPIPSFHPTPVPTLGPTLAPTADPTADPTASPSDDPTVSPSDNPTATPTADPSRGQSDAPTPDIPGATFYDSFEDGTFPGQRWSVKTNTNRRKKRRQRHHKKSPFAGWELTEEEAYQGLYSITSQGAGGNNDIYIATAELELDDDWTPGLLTFSIKADFEDVVPADFVSWYVDDEPRGYISGETEWGNYTVYVEPGSKVFQWKHFHQEARAGDGVQSAFLDQVYFTPSTPIPTSEPTPFPSFSPTQTPTVDPTLSPTQTPTVNPTLAPLSTGFPTFAPNLLPTLNPTLAPNLTPTRSPSYSPTLARRTLAPTPLGVTCDNPKKSRTMLCFL